jgi:small GTP-binding protein
MSEDNVIKVVILGEGRVGKTSILSKYFTKKFNEGEKSTVNPNFYEKTVNQGGKNYQFKFWDTAGQEQFNALSTLYYQGAVGALLVYDVTVYETFQRVETWVHTLEEAVGKDIVIVIAGNKFDISDKKTLDQNQNTVNEYCSRKGCKHFYTSAKTGFNLEEAFDTLTNNICSKLNKSSGGKKGRQLQISDTKKEKDKKGCC